jgi:hypothetical protein
VCAFQHSRIAHEIFAECNNDSDGFMWNWNVYISQAQASLSLFKQARFDENLVNIVKDSLV